MEDQSIFTNNHPKQISDGLQNFIDTMVEEIVLEGKPFDTQKKYLRKFSENEGLDYEEIEKGITELVETMREMESSGSKMLIKLALIQAKDAYVTEAAVLSIAEQIAKRNILAGIILSLQLRSANNEIGKPTSEETVKKLMSDSSPKKKRVWPWIVGIGVVAIIAIAILLRMPHSESDIDTERYYSCQTVSDYRNYLVDFGQNAKYYDEAKQFIDSYMADSVAKAKSQRKAKEEVVKVHYSTEAEQLCRAKAPLKTKALTGTEVGREWVDLGLPSGNRWATMNVGATNPTETGSYFSWGETAAKRSYKWRDYKFRTGGNEIDDIKLSKYNTGVSAFWKHNPNEAFYGPVDNRIRLESIDDAARQIWKGSWRMPTKDDYIELIKYCDTKWIVLDGGKAGIEVTGKNGMKFFLRAGGYWSTSLDCVNFSGEYWTSSLDEDETYCAYMLHFSQSIKPSVSDDWRRLHGRSIRPVLDFK